MGRTAVIGAGMAGLALARALKRRGRKVVLFDKGRAPGGRMSTRRRLLDHGAQYFTARDAGFAEAVRAWEEAGVVERWPNRFRDGAPDDEVRFRGAPHMASLAAHLADGLAIRNAVRIARLACGADGWELHDAQGEAYGPFESVAVTAPAPQAAALLEPVPELRARVAAVGMTPCWAGLFAFDEPLGPDFDGAFLENGLSWVARHERERGESWVLHADPEWSRAHLDAAREDVLAELRNRLVDLVGAPLPRAAYEGVHLWRYARTSEPLGAPCLWDPLRSIGVAGDWCLGGRVEAAWKSGRALASQMLAT